MPAKKNIFKIILIFFLSLAFLSAIIIIYVFNNPDLISSLDPTSTETDIVKESPVETDSLRRLKLDNLYWTRRLELAADKSIDLLVDLPANEVLLEMQGVTVFITPIIYHNNNDALLNLCMSRELQDWLSKSFVLTSEWATITKEPIQIRDIRPGTTNSDDILIRLREPETEQDVVIFYGFSNQLTLAIKQVDNISDSVADSIRIIENQISASPYYLEIFIDHEAAKTIYRALSVEQTGLALRPE